MKTEETTKSTKELFESYFELFKLHECERCEETNLVVISGMIERDFTYSFSMRGQKYYDTEISICRYSGIADTLHLVVPGNLLEHPYQSGKYAEVFGIFSSRNEGGRLVLRVMAYGINFYDDVNDVEKQNCNEVYLSGYICKKPVYRTTPLGRTITDIMLAVHQEDRKSNYIPCIGWSRNALALSDAEVGQKLTIYGRIQSRDYVKMYTDGVEQRTTYEVSISDMRFR